LEELQASFSSGDYTNGGTLLLNYSGSNNLGPGQFTVEGWFNLQDATNGAGWLFTKADFSTYGIADEYAFTVRPGWLEFYHGTRGTNQSVTKFYYPSAVGANTWNHIAVQRDSGGVISVYINGNITTQYQYSPLQGGIAYGALTTGQFTNNVNLTHGSNTKAYIGNGTGGVYFDDIRITVGVSRYSGSTRTAPSAAFPADFSSFVPTISSITAGDSSVVILMSNFANIQTFVIDYVVQYSSDGGSSWTTFSALAVVFHNHKCNGIDQQHQATYSRFRRSPYTITSVSRKQFLIHPGSGGGSRRPFRVDRNGGG
jgi:hypothetical protein